MKLKSNGHVGVRWSRVIYLTALILLWGGLSAKLIRDRYFPATSAMDYISLDTGLKSLPNESEWMNIYHQDRKLGHAVYSIENLADAGYAMRSSTHLNVTFGGLNSEIHMESSAQVDTLFRLESFRFWMLSEQYSTEILGQKSGTALTLDIIQGSDTARSTISVPEDLYTYTAIQPMVASKGIKPGDRLAVPAYDPMSMEMSEAIITHEGKEWKTVAGESRHLNRLKLEFQNIPSLIWLDDNGITYREETIMGMTMERTTPEEALQRGSDGAIDLLNDFAVVPDLALKNLTGLTRLELELEGVDLPLLQAVESPRQQIISTAPLRLGLSREAEVVDPKTIAAALAPSRMVESDHPRIKRRSETILQGLEGPEAQGQVLTRWVFNYLEKRPVASISGAVDILDEGIGDCTEHTTLFAALSRAAGIPTRVRIGLVYVQGRFLFHAWPVIAVDGHWVDVDPSLNQYPADPTHIALVEGDFDRLTDLIPVLGQIKIRVLEQSYGSMP